MIAQPALTCEKLPLEIAVKNDQFVWARCPVRLDLAGGWTDMARVKSGDPSYLGLHDHLKNLAERMRSAISRRNLFQVAALVDESWEANKRIHPSVTNEEIEDLLALARPHYLSAKLLGAGGGGYCLFFSENLRQADRLRQILAAHRHDSARIVEFAIDPVGLQVSVS